MFLIIPYFFIELYFSLKTGEQIGFMWSVIWIFTTFMIGVAVLKNSSLTMLSNMQSIREGRLSLSRFKNASMAYFGGALLLIIPGVFSDFLGMLSLIYAMSLKVLALVAPKQHNNFNSRRGEDEDVIDAEIIDERDLSDRKY